MRIRFVIFSALCIIIHVFCWLFVMNFCAVYINSNKEWIIGSIISISIQLIGLKVVGCLILSLFREITKRYHNVKFVVKTYSVLTFIIRYML